MEPSASVPSLGTIAVLRFSEGPRIGEELAVRGHLVLIGSGPTNDLVMDDDSVSRAHGQLEWAHGGWQLTDLGSTNGTFVEGVRLAPNVPTPLPYGATVRIGTVRLHFRHAASGVPPLGGAAAGTKAPGAAIPSGVQTPGAPGSVPAGPSVPAPGAPTPRPLRSARGLLAVPGWIIGVVLLLLTILGLVFLRNQGVLGTAPTAPESDPAGLAYSLERPALAAALLPRTGCTA